MAMDERVLRALTAPHARAHLERTVAALAAGTDELTLLTRLRAELDPPLAGEVLAQARLRPKALAKLGPRASGLVLLPDALEQASRAEVADARARRLVAAGVRELTDAGAGLGADTLAYAAAGIRVRAVERDPVTAAVLRANVGSLDSVEVLEGDALQLLPGSGVVYFDPARRADGHRIFDPERSAPPLSALLAAHGRGLGVVAKMSPSLQVQDVPPGWDADWVSTQTEQGRAVVEAVLWSPPLGSGRRCAVLLGGGTEHRLIGSGLQLPPVGAIGRYLYEPDGAVNQAGLAGELAAQLDAHPVEPRIAYLSGNADRSTPFAHRYEVLQVLPFAKRRLARALGGYDASDLVIKKRGITLDPNALRKELLPRLRSRTGAPLVVVLTPHRGERLALLTRAA